MISARQKEVFVEGLIFDVVTALKQRCPVDNGELRASIKGMRTFNGAEISMLDYAKYVEYGTPPHIIRPNKRKALKFEPGRKQRLESGRGSKREVFAKEVRHPGTRPQPFIRPVFRDDMLKIITDNAKRYLR